jgi:hypothetical protein
VFVRAWRIRLVPRGAMIHACFACLCVPEVTVDCSRSEGETTAGKAAEQPTHSRANAPQSKLPNVYQRGVPLFLHKPCCTHMYRPCTHLGTFFFRISPFLRVLDAKQTVLGSRSRGGRVSFRVCSVLACVQWWRCRVPPCMLSLFAVRSLVLLAATWVRSLPLPSVWPTVPVAVQES